MSVSAITFCESGMAGSQIMVECHMTNGLPSVIVVGLANKSIDEARERLRSAFAQSNLDFPKKRITFNLAPADLPKVGTSYDYAMAAAIMVAANYIPLVAIAGAGIMGELSLHGDIRPVRGIIGKLLAGRALGITKFFIAPDNLAQASLVPGLQLIAATTLKDFYRHATGVELLPIVVSGSTAHPLPQYQSGLDFSDVAGQARAKRALQIAAAGGHNSLLCGAPGTGKSMLAQALPSILPPLQREEMLEATHLHSLASRQYDRIITNRPFRSIHHSASTSAILGGGGLPRPGEISLSHCGVLFMDELPEFSRNAIECLRQPLEDKTITISRTGGSQVFPANFMLIATCNPCPCGYYGTHKACTCQPGEMARYQRKLSGPILDRIDLYVDVDPVKHDQLLNQSTAESSATIRLRVQAARAAQLTRYGDPLITNASLNTQHIKAHLRLDKATKDFLTKASRQMDLSARAYIRIVKVARTIADLSGETEVTISHISEALQFRRKI